MRRLLVPVLAAASGLAAAQNPDDLRLPNTGKSDWETQQEERDWKETEVRLPAPPGSEGLIEFFVTSASRFRFFIDAPSLSVGSDGVVRYTLVARSASGHDNVSYEGIRCRSGAYRVYAIASGDKWSRANAGWKRIEPNLTVPLQRQLERYYFCPLHVAIQNAAEGVDALRRGGHPLATDREAYK